MNFYATDQQVTAQVMLDSVSCFLTVVYARTTIAARRTLWFDITEVKGRFVSGPWLVCGDFNALLRAHEKKGGSPICQCSCEEFFRLCLTFVSLFMLTLKELSLLGFTEEVFMLSFILIEVLLT